MRRLPEALPRLILAAAALCLGCGEFGKGGGAEAPALELAFKPRAHEELRILEGGDLMPVAIGRKRFGREETNEIGLCFEAPAEADTSQWRARMSFETVDGEGSVPLEPEAESTAAAPRAPDPRLGTHLCFDTDIPETVADGTEFRLCAEIEDAYDGRRMARGCRSFLFDEGDDRWRQLRTEAAELWRGRGEAPLEAYLRSLADLAGRCREAGYPALAARLDFSSAYYARDSDLLAVRDEARRQLLALPAWLERPEAAFLHAQQQYELARLDLIEGELRLAVERLQRSEELYRSIGHPNWLWPIVWQTNILARAGVVREAASRLASVLEECRSGRADCLRLSTAVESQLFHLIRDPEATAEELGALRSSLAETLRDEAEEQAADPGSRANLRINLAHLALLLGEDPAPLLAEAEAELEPLSPEEATPLEGWIRLVRALHALEEGRFGEALALCGEPSADSSDPLAVWVLTCRGQALRRSGRLGEAAEAFARAIDHRGSVTPERLQLDLSLGPSQRAEAYFQAARVEVDRGDPRAAWQILARLDSLAANEEERRRCRERLKASDPEAWRRDQEERRRLEDQLEELEGPASGLRRQQQEALRRTLREELQELARQQARCGESGAREDDRELRFRAFALPEEVLLLHQDARGEVRLHHREKVDRRELVSHIGRVQEAFAGGEAGDAAWRRLLAPLAEYLVPRPVAELPRETTFALHGALQGIPLAALPLDPARGEPRWLGEATTVILRPAGSRALPAASGGEGGLPLFVVNPGLDLLSGAELPAIYEGLFPEARILYGAEATVASLRHALGGALWLHVDAHGAYLPAFPELSKILLADRDLHLYELEDVELPTRFVNLSGCQTGRWPTTADSGHYGFAGLFARRGVGWVIASRADLKDATAKDFNSAFYGALSRGAELAEAYREAMARIREVHAARDWAALFLLRGANDRAEPPLAASGHLENPPPAVRIGAKGRP